jgi:GNAT superfamily N-acetyltransferase
MATTLAIRTPRDTDATALADLSGQLGYPVVVEDMRERMAAVAANDQAGVLVATDAADRPIGWVHVELKRTLSAPLTAQVVGLVVEGAARSAGVGKGLLAAAEAWAQARDCQRMLVGTRITRERAHRFYEREGYTLQKTSYFFEKRI